MPEEQSVHARDGVADPHGCGNPLRSGLAGLATAPDSQLPATSYQLPATSHPFSRPASKTSNTTPIPSKRHPNPTRKASYARRAKRPRQGWRGRSARMRESFAIGHCGPFDGSRLTATSHFPDLPLTPQTTRPSPQSDTQIQQERPAMPEEQSVHARDGVADPHGCGNPLRSGIAGLSTAPDSQPPATHFPDPPLRPQTPRPSPQSDTQIQQERPAMPEEQSVHARDGVADPHGCGNPLRSGTEGLSTAPI